MNNKQKKLKKIENEQKINRKTHNYISLIASFTLLIACLIGRTRVMRHSVITILINNPSEGLPYLLLIVIGVLVFYIVSRILLNKNS